MKQTYLIIIMLISGVTLIWSAEYQLSHVQESSIKNVVQQIQNCNAMNKSLNQALAEEQSSDFLSEIDKAKRAKP